LFLKNYNINYYYFVINPLINKQLYNGFLLIHPILTYISIVYFFNIYKNEKKLKIFNFKKIKIKIIIIFNFSLLALTTGSLWAQQELNWGGWWNWDAIEIILLWVCLNIIFYLHINKKNKIILYSNTYYFNKYIYIILFYFIVRSNLINSIHSFSVSSQVQKHIIIISLVILFFFIIYYFFLSNFNTFKLNLKIVFKNKNKNIFFILIASAIILITVFNITTYILNLKINVNFYKYISSFFKIIIFYILFIYKNLIIRYNFIVFFFYFTSLWFFNFFTYIFFVTIIIIFKKKIFFKKIHEIIFFTIFLLLDFYYIEINFFSENFNFFIYNKFNSLIFFNN